MFYEYSRISVDSAGNQANGNSTTPVFSPDGTKVVFSSAASNLVPGDTNDTNDIFIKDLSSGAVTLVSTTAAGGLGNGASTTPVFSADGTKVAFQSAAGNLVAGDTNNRADIFVKDLVTGAITRVSTSSAGGQANGNSRSVVFSGDGTKVAFTSDASNLVAGDSNGARDIFVKDLVTGVVTRVSTTGSGAQANGASDAFSLSADGLKIAFASTATNLDPNDPDPSGSIYIKDLISGAVAVVPSAGEADSNPVLSPDGSKVAFVSKLGSGYAVSLRDLNSGSVVSMGDNTIDPVFSPDGNELAYEDANVAGTYYVRDLGTNVETGLTQTNGSAPAFAPDGRSVVFASNLAYVYPDSNGSSDIFTGTVSSRDYPVFSIVATAQSGAEGQPGTTTPFTFVVTRSGPTDLVRSVNWAVASSGTQAALASDFAGGVLPSGTLTFGVGEVSKTITVNVAGDAVPEGNEGFAVKLSVQGGAVIANSAAFATILNDEFASPVASVTNVGIIEGDSGSKDAVFTVTLDKVSTAGATIQYATANSAAAGGADYTATSGTLTIAAGAATGTIKVPILGDTRYENTEAFTLTLFNPNGAVFAGGLATLTAKGTIFGDDPEPVASIANATVAEGDSGTTQALFTVTLDKASEAATTFHYATANGTANGLDYTAASGTLTIAAGATTGTIAIAVTGDVIFDGDDTFTLTLSDPAGAVFAGGGATLAATGTILNDDPLPVLSMANVSRAEGDSGSKDAVFVVAMDRPSSSATTIAYELVNGTAQAGSDYTGISGTLTIPAGATIGTIKVPILGDTLQEASETFTLKLSNPVGAVFAGGAATLAATGTIANDDPAPQGQAGGLTLVSADALGHPANGTSLNPTFSPDGSKVAFVSFADNLVPGDSAAAPADIFIKDLITGAVTRVSTDSAGNAANSYSSGPVFSADGTKIAFVSSANNLVAGDTAYYADIFVKDLVTGVVTRASTNGIGDQANGDSASAVFSRDGTKLAFVSYATNLVAGDTNARADIFIKDLVTGAVTRVSTASDGGQANDVSNSFSFSDDWTKIVFTSSATNLGPVSNSQRNIYVKDLTTGVVSLVGSAVAQSNPALSPDGSKVAYITAAQGALSYLTIKDLGTGVITTYQADISASANSAFSRDGSKLIYLGALDGRAYVLDLNTGLTSKLPLPQGQIIGVPVLSADERSVAFGYQEPSGVNDYRVYVAALVQEPTFSIAAVAPTGAEGDSGATPFSFVVTRTGAATTVQSVAWSVAGGGTNRASASDFAGGVLPSGSLTFAVGETSKTITVNVAGDTAVEGNEGFAVRLSAPTGGAVIGAGAAFSTILNDEYAAPVAAVTNASVTEGDSGTRNAVFTVSLDKVSSAAITVKYTTADGAAVAGSDYASASGTLTIAAGATSGTIVVPLMGDTIYEPNETFTLALFDPSGAVFAGGLATTSAIGTIVNDDSAVFNGTDNDDVLNNDPRPVQYGGEGDDRLVRSDGAFAAYGGGGADTLQQNGAFFMNAEGGDGNDWLRLGPAGQSSSLYGGGGSDIIEGGGGGDYIEGGAGNDALYGAAGNDAIYGGDGDDTSTTITAGADIAGWTSTQAGGLYGGAGNDYLDGGQGGDLLDGGADNDRMVGGDGNDAMYGGVGDDYLDGGAGNDRMNGGDGIDTILGGSGLDTAYGGNGNDFIYLTGMSGSKAYGDAGDDQVYAAGGGNFELHGGAGNDTIGSQSGNDTLFGEDGDDLLYGFFGNDTLYGGVGTDRIIGGDGNDILYGGGGLDYFIMNEGFTAGQQDKIMDFQDGVDLVGLPTAVQGHMSLIDTNAGAKLSYSFGAGEYGILFSGATAAQVGDQIYYYG